MKELLEMERIFNTFVEDAEEFIEKYKKEEE